VSAAADRPETDVAPATFVADSSVQLPSKSIARLAVVMLAEGE
jgi:hypothetical protein